MDIDKTKQIEYEILQSAKCIVDSEEVKFPFFRNSVNSPGEGEFVFFDDDKFHYIYMERGRIVRNVESEYMEPIVYLVLKRIISESASKLDKDTSKTGYSSRRVQFKKQLELFEKLYNKSYYEMRKKEIDRILEISPYND
ncbi:MAG: Imm63 family immunity protein [Erysipelothrix sp.]